MMSSPEHPRARALAAPVPPHVLAPVMPLADAAVPGAVPHHAPPADASAGGALPADPVAAQRVLNKQYREYLHGMFSTTNVGFVLYLFSLVYLAHQGVLRTYLYVSGKKWYERQQEKAAKIRLVEEGKLPASALDGKPKFRAEFVYDAQHEEEFLNKTIDLMSNSRHWEIVTR